MKIDMKKALYCLLGLTFLQDSSADVTRLKLNLTREDLTELETRTFIERNGLKIGNCHKCWQYGINMYCDNDGFVYINLHGASQYEARNIAKLQFENIIRSGLVKKNIINTQIYNTQFTDRATWKIPGISADISDLSVSNIPVMCGAKTECNDINALLEKQDWINFCNNRQNVTKNLQRFEHTERQFLAYYISGQTYGNEAWLSTGKIVNNNIGNRKQHYLIYTHGAPCFDENI